RTALANKPYEPADLTTTASAGILSDLERITMKHVLTVLAVTLLISAAFAEEKEKKQWDQPPKMSIDVNKKYTATLDSDKGKIVVELFPKESPKSVNNFVFLAKQGFYDGTIFHRVIPNF